MTPSHVLLLVVSCVLLLRSEVCARAAASSWSLAEADGGAQSKVTTAKPHDVGKEGLVDDDEDYDEDADDDDEDSDESYLDDLQLLKPSEADRQLEAFKSELDCPQADYDKMKDGMLYYFEKRMRGRYVPGKELLLSLLFMHLDKDMDGHLSHKELEKVSNEVNGDWPKQCHPSLLIVHDDEDGDELLGTDEFFKAFNKALLSAPIEGVSVVSLEKELQFVRRRARLGDNVELACDVSGTPTPPIVWERNGVYLGSSRPADSGPSTAAPPPHYPAVDLGLRVFEDGSLFVPSVQIYHTGNFSCYATRNPEVVQTHHLDVFTLPTVAVEPRVQTRQPGEDAVVFCHVTGEPSPQVQWLKGEEPLRATDPRKYVTVGNGTELRVRHVDFADTGAYFCQAKSAVGTTRDMSTLVVIRQDGQALKLQTMQHRFFVFHDRGISIHDPRACRLQHFIRSSAIVPGTKTALCGEGPEGPEGSEGRCQWGEALNVEDRYIYVTQPTLHRVVILSVPLLAVVEVVATDPNPVRLTYVPHTGQVWVLNWRSEQGVDQGTKTIQVIRGAVEKRRHSTVHLEPVRGQFDLVQDLFVPPFGRDLMRGMRHGYASHAHRQALSKIDLAELRYARTVDLSGRACVPTDMAFSALYGFVLVRCQDPKSRRDSKLLVLDYMTDVVVAEHAKLAGRLYLTPDSRKLVVLQAGRHGVNIVVMRVTADGLAFHFDIKSTLNVSDVAFFPSTSAHGYDMFASTVDKEDVLFLDLLTGQVEMITGAGKPLPASRARWGAPNRPLYAPGTFDRFLVTPGYDAVFVINGHTRAVNCEVGGVDDPRLAVWASTMPQ